jgi:hypothetical protein
VLIVSFSDGEGGLCRWFKWHEVGFEVGGRWRRSYSLFYSDEDVCAESGGHRVAPRPTCHKVLVMLRTTDQFIDSISSVDCEGVSPYLDLVAALLYSGWRFGGSGNRRWMMVGRDVKDSKDRRVFFIFIRVFFAILRDSYLSGCLVWFPRL